MLSFDVRSLAHQAAPVSGELSPSDPIWNDADVLPSTPVKVTGRLSSAGGGRYYFAGHISGGASESCTRCLEPLEVSVYEDVRAIFAEPGSEGADDPDVYPVEQGSANLDLRPAVREHWLLNVPRFALCSETCRGLCPQCGENLNVTTCACAQTRDSRWDALRSARHE